MGNASWGAGRHAGVEEGLALGEEMGRYLGEKDGLKKGLAIGVAIGAAAASATVGACVAAGVDFRKLDPRRLLPQSFMPWNQDPSAMESVITGEGIGDQQEGRPEASIE